MQVLNRKELIPGLFSGDLTLSVTYWTQQELAEVLNVAQSYISQDVAFLKKATHPIHGGNYLGFAKSGFHKNQAFYIFLMRLWMDAQAFTGKRPQRKTFIELLNHWKLNETGDYYQPLLLDFIAQVELKLSAREGKDVKLLDYFNLMLEKHCYGKMQQRAYTIEPVMV